MFLNCGYPAYHKDGKIRYEHMDVAEQKIGRHLGKHEVVHHVDGNKENNNPDNILILRNDKSHNILHKTEFGVETFTSKDGSTVVVQVTETGIGAVIKAGPKREGEFKDITDYSKW